MEAPEERRERLKRLREEIQASGGAPQEPSPADGAPDQPIPHVHFRNYKPRDDKFAANTVAAAKPRPLDAAADTPAPDAPPGQTAIDLYAPKKPHLDLKRDAAKSLRKLERATQRAIDELRVELELQEGHVLNGQAPAGDC